VKIKNTAITYAGYAYQTLQGVLLLAEWLKSPSRYKRAQIEADLGKSTGIDDIVFERPDGTRDFWQIKFTPNEEKHLFSWDWLLEKSGKTDRSRSILKKINDAIESVPSHQLGKVILLTNRVPDRAIEGCLNKSKIDFSKIDIDTQNLIIEQIGSASNAKTLFSKLTIQHSDYNLLNLSRKIRTALLKHSDEAGINRLMNSAQEWAIHTNHPDPDGWIQLHHLREVLSPRRPEPIPEIFSVPDHYIPPDMEFHNSMTDKICSSNGGIFTLTGKPGAGKSTYLSYLCQSLEQLEIPLIRHHYFLSLSNNEDRISPHIVAESLLHQIRSFHSKTNSDTSKPEELKKTLLTCANYYQKKDRPFVVVIDGLDHVWRDNSNDKQPLEDVFKQLLPVHENLVLLIGTQPVDDTHLPKELVRYCPKNDWLWLLEMTGNSIFKLLTKLISSNRLYTNRPAQDSKVETKKAAQALHAITHGYPLHVIYSIEYLAQQNLPLSSYSLEKLPSCSDGNIETYYSELWKSLNNKQRDVLHLCCGFQFTWPKTGLSTVLKDNTSDYPNIKAVSHMLFEGISGVRPFHESLVVFVKNIDEHSERIQALLPEVCNWLESVEAPTHLKDKWLWSSHARLGNSTPLREGLSRNWVLDKLAEGINQKDLIRLLTEAETIAFQENEFAEAYKHRSLKTRLLNGPEFQIDDTQNLEILSLINSSTSQLNDVLAGQNEFSPLKLSKIATVLWKTGNIEQACLLATKALSRFKAKNKILNADNQVETNQLITALTLTDKFDHQIVFSKGNFSSWSDEFKTSFRKACIKNNDISLLLKARSALSPTDSQCAAFELSAIRASILEEANIRSRAEYKNFTNQKLSTFFDCIEEGSYKNIQTFEPPSSAPRISISERISYSDWFFSSLSLRLTASGSFSWLPACITKERVDISGHLGLIDQLTDLVAQELKSHNLVSFDFVCSILPPLPILDENNWESQRADKLCKKAWIDIAADIHLLTQKQIIDCDSLEEVINSNLYPIDLLREWYFNDGHKRLSDNAVELLITTDLSIQEDTIEPTSHFSNRCLQLAELAYKHENTALFQKCLRRSWDFTIGYDDHKDSTIFTVLNGIEYLSARQPQTAIKFLERISPIVFNISEFTDGDETRYAKNRVSSLLSPLIPQTAASKYDQELIDGEWYYADETLEALIENADLSLPITIQILLTGLKEHIYKPLIEKAELGDSNAKTLKAQVENLLGKKIETIKDDRYSGSNKYSEKIEINPLDFPPNKFLQLIEELKGKYETKEFWINWYQHWIRHEQESELLENILPNISILTNRLGNSRYLLDLLFESQKKLNGKTKAFDLIVKAHTAASAWSGWSENTTKSLQRLKTVSKLYKTRINDFIKKTTSEVDPWKSHIDTLIIPNDKLVFLLSEAGRDGEATELTLAMIKCLEEDTQNLNLSKPNWDWCQEDSIEHTLSKILVTRLKSPVPSIKLWTLEQLSDQLAKENSVIEDLLLADLSSRKLESECIEVLCVFLAAKDKGYTPSQDLGRYINTRSALSDMILKDIKSTTTHFGNYSTNFTPAISLTTDNNQFDYYQGTHVPLLYNSWLERLQHSTGIELTDYFKSEWNNTFEYEKKSSSTIDYFLGSDRNSASGQFYTKQSHRGRSAYLRTIEVAKQFFRMPETYAQDMATIALPIEPAYLGLTTDKPNWISHTSKLESSTHEKVEAFATQVLTQFNLNNPTLDLLSVSFPIRIDDNNWIDLTILNTENDEVSSETVEINQMQILRIGNLLNRELHYQNSLSSSKLEALADTSYPINRFGHWHSDLESRGFYIPKTNIKDAQITGKANGNKFSYYIEDEEIGFSSYWNTEWNPVHPNGVKSLCGTFTAVEKSKYAYWRNLMEDNSEKIYLCSAKIMTREQPYEDFIQEKFSFNLKI